MINSSAVQEGSEFLQDNAGESFQEAPVVIPVIEERITVNKRVVETGKVHITKSVHEHEEVVNIPVIHEEVTVERIPMNQFVETAPPVRYEGETMIVPVVKEVLVVEKRLQLIEELHITKQRIQTGESRQVTLRSEEVTVERLPGEHTDPLSD